MNTSRPFRGRIGPPRGRPPAKPPPRAGVAARACLAKFQDRFGPGLSEISARWTDIAGEKLARATTPVKLAGRGPKGVLHVRARGAAAVMAQAEAARILGRLETFCGAKIAGKLAVIRAPAAPAAELDRAAPRAGPRSGLTPRAALALEESLADVANPGLKAALRKLGASVLAAERDEDARDVKASPRSG